MITAIFSILIVCILAMGYGFDRAHPYSNKNASRKQLSRWSYFAHIMAETAMIISYLTIICLNSQLFFLAGLGAIAWVGSTIVMGIIQAKGRKDRNWLYFGDGKASTPEILTSCISKTFRIKYITASVILRVGIIIIGVLTSTLIFIT